MLRGDGQQICGALALRPERLPPRRMTPRQEQRAARGLAKTRRKQRRAVDRAADAILDVRRAGQEPLARRRLVRGRNAEDHAVVRPHAVDVSHAPRAQCLGDRGGPGRVHARAERRQHAHAMIADLVQETFDHDHAIARHFADRVQLLVHVLGQAARRRRVQEVLRLRAALRRLVDRLGQWCASVRRPLCRIRAGALGDRRAKMAFFRVRRRRVKPARGRA